MRLFLLAVMLASATAAGSAEAQVRGRIDPDGTVHLPSVAIPYSSFASPEAKKAFLESTTTNRPPVPTGPIDRPGPAIDRHREAMNDHYYRPMLAKQMARYQVSITAERIAGVPVEIFVPTAGIAPAQSDKVLINLHGGAFFMGAVLGGRIESIPIAHQARMRVISVDYRMGPEHRFPAASEDVATVYRELLKTYRPENIGIYGCSAGGALTAQAIAWFDRERLPMPGAIGIFCASAARFAAGDGAYLSPLLNGEPSIPPSLNTDDVLRAIMSYFADANLADRLIAPADFPDLLARFPPTLMITGSRAGEFSTAIETHRRLTRLGVDADLHVWDAMQHGHIYDADLPEAREAYDVTARFFREHLGRIPRQ